MVDEDSLLSLPSDYTPDDKSELVRILEEVSCSSSSEGSEDEEISVVDEPGGRWVGYRIISTAYSTEIELFGYPNLYATSFFS